MCELLNRIHRTFFPAPQCRCSICPPYKGKWPEIWIARARHAHGCGGGRTIRGQYSFPPSRLRAQAQELRANGWNGSNGGHPTREPKPMAIVPAMWLSGRDCGVR